MERSEHIAAELLSAHADGDLDPHAAARVASHVAGCARCTAELELLTSMRVGLRELRDTQVPPHLWTRIETRAKKEGLSRPRTSPWSWLTRPQWLMPAAAFGALAIAFVVGWWLAPRDSAHTPTPRVAALAPDASAPRRGTAAAIESVARAEASYRAAIERLKAAADVGRAAWSPKVGAAVERSLAEIDRAIERCRTALRAHPDDARAQEAMLAAYQQKVDLLTELSEEAM